jgi:hypothetical protein
MGNQSSKPNTSSEDRVFTKFPELPPELRLDILALVAPEPRVVVLDERRRKSWSNYDAPTATAPSIGGMLSANYDARREMLKGWKPCFGSWLGSPIWFNPDRDILLSEKIIANSFRNVATREDGESIHFILWPSIQLSAVCQATGSLQRHLLTVTKQP